ncbi:plasma-membrane proton-efflux P-type ATPase [Nitrosomonas sp.]|uniref:plasma-membrane proton-efflux P-type ATPase n=1 Tax=Nitrosomonas sp. TaxID=42353 RepID=UPI0025D52DE2|nr:plasma-membrane proton-efflux P-type ATPase [Nitrosomonas sp.]MCC6915864.1 plasma-membrane proton-efflux P-type ATPase [Nitrosomonas sp.]
MNESGSRISAPDIAGFSNEIPQVTGLTGQEADARFLRDGPNEIPEVPRHPVLQLLRKFWGLSAWMLEIIAILSFVLDKQTDFWIAVVLLFINAILGFFQEQRASSAVATLRHRLQITARVFRGGIWRLVPARELVTEDIVRLRGGDFVPADMRVIDGDLRVDQSALTGESIEITRQAGAVLYSGSIIRRGEATAIVTATGQRTYFGRTAQLVENAHPKLHVEEITARLVKWLLAIVGVLVTITLALSMAQGRPLLDVLPLSLVLLMSAVPVAFPVMFAVSTAVGTMELGRYGVLVTHLSAVEDAANMEVLCADKTGTLTMNRMTLSGVFVQPGFSEDDVIQIAAFASNPANQDQIDLAFLHEASRRDLLVSDVRTLSFVPFTPETRRTESVVNIGGHEIHAVKGALRTVAGLAGLGPEIIASLEARADEEAVKGARVLAVAQGSAGTSLQFAGLAFLRDSPRPDSCQLIEQLRSLGIRVKMLTGDGLPVAREIAHELGLGDIARAADLQAARKAGEICTADLVARSEGFAEVFPEDKFLVVKSLQSAGHVVGMTGDGVNDAPALSQAEVGIAVSGATEVAKGAASVVLTEEGLASIVELVKIGRATYQRILTWIINKVSRTIMKAGFVVIAFFITGEFVISALSMLLLTFITDFVKIALSVDHVQPSQTPESWRIGPLVKVAVILGLLMLLEVLGLLAIGMHMFDLTSNRLDTFSFLALLFFSLFSIISIRERRAFWRSRPGWVLAAALAADALIGSSIGFFGLAELDPLPSGQIAFIAAYAFTCSLVLNDMVKTFFIERLWIEPRRIR